MKKKMLACLMAAVMTMGLVCACGYEKSDYQAVWNYPVCRNRTVPDGLRSCPDTKRRRTGIRR